MQMTIVIINLLIIFSNNFILRSIGLFPLREQGQRCYFLKFSCLYFEHFEQKFWPYLPYCPLDNYLTFQLLFKNKKTFSLLISIYFPLSGLFIGVLDFKK